MTQVSKLYINTSFLSRINPHKSRSNINICTISIVPVSVLNSNDNDLYVCVDSSLHSSQQFFSHGGLFVLMLYVPVTNFSVMSAHFSESF